MVTQVVQMFVLPGASRFASRGEFQSLKDMVEKSIAFLTIMMVPVFIILLVLAPFIVDIIYTGRYSESAQILQIFSALSILVPLMAVASNTLMGLGQARLSFVLSMQFLVASAVIYAALIPLFGVVGAAIGYVLASLFLAWRSSVLMVRFVPTTFAEVARRTRDVKMYVVSRVVRFRNTSGGA
jgi:O-antigen/teichoic acid export membrane protein